MQDFFSILPFLIFLTSVGFFILIGASIFLVRDLRMMQREHQEGEISLWYKRPKSHSSLKWMGYALLAILAALAGGVITSLPRTLSNISEIGVAFIGASILFVIVGSSLISNLRNLKREHREGFPSIWHRQPKIMRQAAYVAFSCGLLLEMGYTEYALLAQYFLRGFFQWNILLMAFIPCIFYLLSIFLYLHSVFLKALNRRSY